MSAKSRRSSRHALILMTALAIALGPSRSFAGDFETTCPGNLPIASGYLPGVPDGWTITTGYALGPPPLVVLTVADSSHGAIRAYRESARGNGDFLLEWKLSASWFPLYVECVYQNTTVTVRRPIPDGVRSCRYLFRANVEYRKDETITCH